ncbi:hypothetical protein [Alteraurantiacibacter aquimixticola]|uniref:Uncharacterized protein n=1 Tax=Alteraurantiacibacter aquimixticola TaxID=2489173 RepID=A0A4T3F2E1_9SPHN|nr:hypothetical protein [Alteraurantiacibacter aquimixticola]TIX50240.1 hypothetical protein E5222_08105 [Alteraurantiacibacter aquimixticola]
MRSLPLAAIGALASIATYSPARAQVSDELYDYLVQDVCVNSAGDAVQGDPASCPDRRNIRLAEASPYLLTDYDTQHSKSYSAWASIPVRGEDGNIRVLVTKNNAGDFGPHSRFSFTENDGFDLIDISYSPYASIIRTWDGGCFDQAFAPSSQARTGRQAREPRTRAGGWVLFPLATPPSAWPETSSARIVTAKIQLVRRENCRTGSSRGRTYWNAPADYEFETGKILHAIRSDHFASANLSSSNNALERFYFTREYGMTRWEAWIPRSRCYSEAEKKGPGELRSNCEPDLRLPVPYTGPDEGAPEIDLRARCAVLDATATDHPDIDRWGGQDWVRVDCRDQTRYVPLALPQVMTDPAMAQGNEVDDIAF